jgi:hypothetical protein
MSAQQSHYSEFILTHEKWDGSSANKAARQRAAKDLLRHAARLERFANRRPGSKVAALCYARAAYLERVANRE